MGLTVRWDITRNCNLICKHCSVYDNICKPESTQLSLHELFMILDRLSEEKVDLIKLFGGEPLLREDINQLINEAYLRKIPVGITTNGTIPLDTKLEELIVDNKIKYITISLDSDDDTINAVLRPADTVKIISKNIKYLASLKTKYGLPLKIAVNCVLNSENCLNVRSLLEFVSSNRVDKISFANLVPRGRAKNMFHLIPTPEQLLQTSLIIADYYSKHTTSAAIEPFYAPALIADYIRIKYNLAFPITSYRCRAATEVCYIDASGNLFPCESIADRYQMENNNLLENDFRKIWNASIFNSVFQEIVSGVAYTSDLCKACKYCFQSCYPCVSWSMKPKVCELIQQQIPDIFEVII